MTNKEQELNIAQSYGATAEPCERSWYVYTLNGWRIWRTRVWTVAKLIDGRYCQHKFIDDLEDALKYAKEN